MAGKNTAVFGIYPTAEQAERAVDTIIAAGFRTDDISVLLPDNRSTKEFAHEKDTKAPEGTTAGVTAGGVLDQPIHTLSIECLAISIPDTIRVNIAELQIGSAIHVRALVLPAGVKAMSDPEAIVVQVKQPVAEEEAPVAAEAAEAAEPEVIGAKEKAEAEEESE